jgi:hypothetical protein
MAGRKRQDWPKVIFHDDEMITDPKTCELLSSLSRVRKDGRIPHGYDPDQGLVFFFKAIVNGCVIIRDFQTKLLPIMMEYDVINPKNLEFMHKIRIRDGRPYDELFDLAKSDDVLPPLLPAK